MRRVPAGVRRTIVSVHGADGETWLQRLDTVLEECQARFGCRVGRWLPGLSYNLLLEARGEDGSDLVLKIGVPNREFSAQVQALRLYRARGAVRRLRSDARVGALLLERLRPGTSLSAVGDEEESLRIFEDVYRKLRRPQPARGEPPRLQDWGLGLDRMVIAARSGSLPLDLAEEAATLFRQLLASTEQEEFLHGDLHHDNILLGSQGWTAIDPKGVVGDRCYDTAAYLINRLEPDLAGAEGTIGRRIDHLARELGLARPRILGWVRVHAALSAFWNFEGGVGDVARGLALAEILRRMA